LKSRKTHAMSDYAANMIHRGLTGVDWLAGLPGNPSGAGRHSPRCEPVRVWEPCGCSAHVEPKLSSSF